MSLWVSDAGKRSGGVKDCEFDEGMEYIDFERGGLEKTFGRKVGDERELQS
jgi:hypothetical protein